MATLRLAHRGDWRRAPENTIEALTAALRVPGCDGIEFDVRSATDGTAVVIHDDGLWRVQRVDALVRDLGTRALAEREVPSLASVLKSVGRQPFLDIELKEWVPDAIPAIERARADGTGSIKRAVISSFHEETLRSIRALHPAWPVWLNHEESSPAVFRLAKAIGCAGVSIEWRALDEDAVGRAHSMGLDVAAWTVRNRATFARLERLGVMAICVEGPALSS
jgi:glycerophosphoryl diester phosphodiesterase